MVARTVLSVFVGGVLVFAALVVAYVVSEASGASGVGYSAVWVGVLLALAGVALLVMRALGRRSGL